MATWEQYVPDNRPYKLSQGRFFKTYRSQVFLSAADLRFMRVLRRRLLPLPRPPPHNFRHRRRDIRPPAAKDPALRRARWRGSLRALLLPFHHQKCPPLIFSTHFITQNARVTAEKAFFDHISDNLHNRYINQPVARILSPQMSTPPGKPTWKLPASPHTSCYFLLPFL